MPSVFDDIHQEQQSAAATPSGSVFDDIHAEASPTAPPSMASRIGRGALRGFGLPDSRQALNELDPMTWLHDVKDAIHDGRYGHAAAAIGAKLMGPAGNLVQGGYDQLQRSYDALKQKDYNRALIHLGVAGMQALTPIAPGVMALPGMANAADVAASGDVAGGVAQGVTGGVASALGLRAGVADPNAVAKQLADTATRAQSAKLMNEAFKPESPQKFNSATFDYVLPLLEHTRGALVKGDRALTYEDLPQATAMAMENNRAQFRAYANQAEMQGLTAPADPIADAMIKAIPRKTQDLYPSEYKKLVDSVNDTYRGKNLSSDAFESYNRTNNAVMDAFHNKLTSDQNTALAASTTKAMQDAEADATRNSWYRLIDKAGNGENVAELQRRWGALKGFRDEQEKLQGKLLNQDTSAKPFQAANLLKWLNPKSAMIDVAKKGMQKALQMEEDPRDAVAKINQSLSTYRGGPRIPDVPAPQFGLVPPEGRVPPYVQQPLDLGGNAPGNEVGPNSMASIHAGKGEPLDLQKSPRGEFNRQEQIPLHGVPHQPPVGSPDFNLEPSPTGKFYKNGELWFEPEAAPSAPNMRSGPIGHNWKPIDPNDLYELIKRQRKAGQQPVEMVGPKELPPATVDISKWLLP